MRYDYEFKKKCVDMYREGKWPPTPKELKNPKLVSVDRAAEITYVVNTNTQKFYYPSWSAVEDMKEKNRQDSTKSREELMDEGFTPCKRCKP